MTYLIVAGVVILVLVSMAVGGLMAILFTFKDFWR